MRFRFGEYGVWQRWRAGDYDREPNTRLASADAALAACQPQYTNTLRVQIAREENESHAPIYKWENGAAVLTQERA